MASPFPGMDPYLEDRNIWPGFHHALAEEIKAQLNGLIGPKYYADVEVHTIFEDISVATARAIYPDVGVFEPTLPEPLPLATATQVAIPPAPLQRVAITGQTKLRAVRVYVTDTDELVTSIEILSPYNKRGEGLADYRRKRSQLLSSLVHLVEIDLLRGGQRPGRELNDPALDDTDYILLVNRGRGGNPQRLSDIWPVALNEPLPLLPVPLLAPDPDIPLDLNAAIRSVYVRTGYAWRLNYHQPVPPPRLRPAMQAWLEQRLANA